MYQVIKMYGDNEPWWFFENWQSDIKENWHFEHLEEAKQCYKEQWLLLKEQYDCLSARRNFLCAFWNSGEEAWCEACGEDVQQYMGLALLKNNQAIEEESEEEFYETANIGRKAKCCQGFKSRTRGQKKT
ncbi:hypothetical protein M2139_000787 [Enterococcus sp. PF1-24]|uniref:DUF1033 family protein n=1 Tax=unclassified Enterococcus TaxID=2608891 RepID=UPI00247357AC|nr:MULTISPECIES: DUF1033 family protein [unclassified Enterococcus]MDH6363910.1 hypothetical protein [Enterococcus sp. PFB1-1]MDH6400904.1 hypothetical protein [Enterococcus sp. PF1-24]